MGPKEKDCTQADKISVLLWEAELDLRQEELRVEPLLLRESRGAT